MKKTFALAFLCSILSFSTVFAKDITVTLNNEVIPYTQKPMLNNGTTCVPMKQTLESIGAIVSWNEPTKTVIARKGDLIVSACLNSKTLIITKGEETSRVTMQLPAYIQNGTMFVPLRPILQAFKTDMTWDNNTNTANITTDTLIVSEKTEQKTIQNSNGETVWQANLSYPQLQGNTEAIANINQIIKNDVITSLTATANDVSPDDINTNLESHLLPYTFDSTYNVTYLDDNTISLILDYYELTGGAHGMPYRQTYTFDLNTGNQLQLKDILDIEDVDAFAKDAFKNNILQNPENYFLGAEETVDSDTFAYDFYLQPNEIVFFTQAYLLEPYANHFQPTTVYASEIQNILKINL